jgi:hypothetical protein
MTAIRKAGVNPGPPEFPLAPQVSVLGTQLHRLGDPVPSERARPATPWWEGHFRLPNGSAILTSEDEAFARLGLRQRQSVPNAPSTTALLSSRPDLKYLG